MINRYLYILLLEVISMLKKNFILTLILLSLQNFAIAQEVIVDGIGVDRNSAVRDAIRNAIENVVGTFVNSTTLTQNSVLQLDEIYTNSQGFVKNIVVLNEGSSSVGYMVTAQIDVDTNPNSQLMDKLNMLAQLNDPRIAVAVLKNEITDYDYSYIDNDSITESQINEKLIKLGFNHVADINLLAKLKNSDLLNSIYNGDNYFLGEVEEYGIDYLVIGKNELDSNTIYLPNNDGTYTETMLMNSKAILTIKIIKFDTGEIVETFKVDGNGIEQNEIRAKNKAIKVVADKAAQNIANKFRKLAAKAYDTVQLIINCNNYDDIESVINILKNMAGIQNVHIREYKNNKAIVDVDTLQKPHVLVELLKKHIKGGMFIDSISNSKIELSVF